MRLDHLVGAGGAQAQRPFVTSLVCSMHHRPFVQAETAELGCSGGGRGEQEVQLAQERALFGHVAGADLGSGADCLVALQPGMVLGVFEPYAEAGMPAPQLGRTIGVVGEQEVMDRVFLTCCVPGQVRYDEGVHARGVALCAGAPLLTAQYLHGSQG